MSAPLLELKSVGYEQKGVAILNDVSWTVHPAQHWALLGPNGSGKTTLLKVATGYLWHTSGTVVRQGVELKDLGAYRMQIGWISADIISLIPASETAVETVVSGKFAQFGLRYLQCTTPTADEMEQAAEELRRIDCLSLAEKPFAHLSQGERQQVLIARTRMAGPSLLVLDEPCAGMDPGVRERFLAWLQQQLTDPEFPTVMFATHHLEEVVPGLSQALIMVEGRIQNAGSADEVLTQSNLESAYGIPLQKIDQIAGRKWAIWGV